MGVNAIGANKKKKKEKLGEPLAKLLYDHEATAIVFDADRLATSPMWGYGTV